jgi:hypothetical protein
VQAYPSLETAGRQLLKDELGRDDPWRMAEPRVMEFLASRQNKMSGVPGEVHQTIMSALREGIDAGESIDTLQSRVRTTCNGLSRSLAQRYRYHRDSCRLWHSPAIRHA